MLRPLFLLVLGLGLAATQARAQAQTPAISLPGRSSNALQERFSSEQRSQRATLVEADAISGTPDIELQLRGNASVRRADTLIRARQIDYDVEHDQLKASGAVRINRAGNVFEGTELDLSVDAFSGFFSQPHFRLLKGGGYGQADQIEFIDDQRAIARTASYTTCTARPGPSWLPDWIVRATELSMDNQRNEARAKGATLRFKNVTVPIPEITFPLNEDRKSGFLPPLAGVDTANGLTYIQPYYFNLAPNRDATLTTSYYARRGLALGGEFRYLEKTAPDTRGELRFNYMPNDQIRGVQRWAFSHQHVSHSQFREQDLQLRLNINRVSDDNYWKDFPFAANFNQRLLPFDVGVSSTRGDWTTRVRSLRWQTVTDLNSPLTPPYDRNPQITLQYAPQLENWDLNWVNDFTSFSSDRLQACLSNNPLTQSTDCQPNAQRLVSHVQAARPFHAGWLTIKPKLSLMGRQYQYDTSLTTVDPSRFATAHYIPSFSLDTSAQFERDAVLQGKNWRQTLEPRLLYVHTPYRNQSALPVYDSARYDFNFSTIFSENPYTGYDRQADNQSITLGAITRFINPLDGAEGARFGVAQRLRLREQRVTLPTEQPLNDRLSDLLLGATVNLNRQWLFDSTVQYNPQTNNSDRAIFGVRYNPTPYRLFNVAYRNQSQFQSELLDVAWQWPLNDLWGDRGQDMGPGRGQGEGRWYTVARLNYSIPDHKLADTILGLEYDAGCWLSRIVIQQQQLGTLVNTRRIMFQLEFSGFGRVGANPLQQLQTQIPRYQMLRDNQLPSPSRFGLYD